MLVGYFILVVLIGFMASILIHERHRISEIDSQTAKYSKLYVIFTMSIDISLGLPCWERVSLIGTEQTVVITVSNVCVQIACYKH